jgi:hypothetical protein
MRHEPFDTCSQRWRISLEAGALIVEELVLVALEIDEKSNLEHSSGNVAGVGYAQRCYKDDLKNFVDVVLLF